MATEHRTWLDVLAGLLLAGCLFRVFSSAQQDEAPASPPAENTLKVVEVKDAGDSRSEPKRLGLAVISPSLKGQPWDDMGKLLAELGEAFRFDEIAEDFLKQQPALLDRTRYDVVFLTCAPGGDEYKDQLARFIREGGVLYASDHRYMALTKAFPERKDNGIHTMVGSRQDLAAEVVDPEMRKVFGATIDLHFDQDYWVPASLLGPGVTPLVQGTYHRKDGGDARAPLLVKFQEGKGTVIFTSFHNEKQNSQKEKELLQYLVFHLVTTAVEFVMQEAIAEGGFQAKPSNLLTTREKDPPLTRPYTHAKPGPLRFALGFRSKGARLQFTITSPDKKSFTGEYGREVILEVPDAPTGEWTYTVAPLEVPKDQYLLFSVSVGEKK
jgi:hypothetical protein